MGCAKRLARPVRLTEDFKVDLHFPPSAMFRCIEWVDPQWKGKLDYLTTDSGYTHEHLANIPPHVLAWPGPRILFGVVQRCLAGIIYPQRLILTASGPCAWTLLAGLASGTVIGVILGFLCSAASAATVVVIASTTYLVLLWSGLARSCAQRLAAASFAVETTDDTHDPTLCDAKAPATDRGAAPSGKKRDEIGVLNGESVEIIMLRFLQFTRFGPLDIGEKYIGPGAFASWTKHEEEFIMTCVQQNDIGSGTIDWRAVEEEFRKQKVEPAALQGESIHLQRSSGDLRRHYEDMKKRAQVKKLDGESKLVYRRVLPSLLNRVQHRNKAGIVMDPELLTVEQLETAQNKGKTEWIARTHAFLAEVPNWTADKQLRDIRGNTKRTGSQYLRRTWENAVEAHLRKKVARKLWSTYLHERNESNPIPVSARALGRTLTRNSPEGGVSWGEFLSFHLQEPSQLQQDHVDEILKVQPSEQRALIHKLLAVAISNFRAEEARAPVRSSVNPISRHHDRDVSRSYPVRKLPVGHHHRIVNKIIYNFDSLCTQALEPGRTHKISTEDGDEEWVLIKPKPKGTESTRPFYYEKHSTRKQWEKPWTGKTRCESHAVTWSHATKMLLAVLVLAVLFCLADSAVWKWPVRRPAVV